MRVTGCTSVSKTAAEVASNRGIAETTWHRWNNTYGQMFTNDANQLKESEAESRRLKTIVADLTLDGAILKEMASGKF